jgi:hypothetical protein
MRSQGADADAAVTIWHTVLAEQLVALVVYPLAPRPGVATEQIWPGVDTLIAAIESALQGQDSAGFASGIETAWQQAVALTESQELLNAALTLLEEAAEQRLAAALVAARPAITALFHQLRTAMLRSRLAYEAAKNQSLMTAAEHTRILAWPCCRARCCSTCSAMRSSSPIAARSRCVSNCAASASDAAP